MADVKSIKRLRVYQTSRELEDSVYMLVKALPETEFYALGNDLRRSSAAISHYLMQCHRHYSHNLKLEALHLARTEAETLQNLLLSHDAKGYGSTDHLGDACISVIKQCWGLIKYFKQRQAEQSIAASVRASDELVASRS
ncbi:MAG TPA: four helix bundle protein [Candidatus Saccharimonadia bacterium]